MIENVNANEILGQLEMTDLEGSDEVVSRKADGYDENGNLLAYPAGNHTESPIQVPEESEIRLNTLAAEINAITNHARVVLASAAIDIGKRLIEAKNIVPRGRWTEWLEANVDYSERKAQQLMQLAEEFGRGELPAGLGISQMTALLAAPEGERGALAEKAVDEGLSVRELQEEIRKLRGETDEKQMEIEGISSDNDSLNEIIKEQAAEIERNKLEAANYEAKLERLSATEAALDRASEAARLAEAKAKAAEASADELRKLHSDAEDRAAASAQNARDAVQRANKTAKELGEARARIAELEEEARAAGDRNGPEIQTVEVVPEAVQNELADLRRQLAELQKPSHSGEGGPRSGSDEVASPVTAVARFRDSYKRLTDEFKTAEALIAEIVKDDAKTGHMYATAMVKSCKMMIERLGE